MVFLVDETCTTTTFLPQEATLCSLWIHYNSSDPCEIDFNPHSSCQITTATNSRPHWILDYKDIAPLKWEKIIKMVILRKISILELPEIKEDEMCKISNLLDIASMDLLACKICPKMPFLDLGPT